MKEDTGNGSNMISDVVVKSEERQKNPSLLGTSVRCGYQRSDLQVRHTFTAPPTTIRLLCLCHHL